jgi:3-hydroxybutyryl-CoA dehydrogenase
LDTHLHATEAIHEENGDPRFVPPTILRRMVRAGRLGKKSGQGFYDYRGKDGAEG